MLRILSVQDAVNELNEVIMCCVAMKSGTVALKKISTFRNLRCWINEAISWPKSRENAGRKDGLFSEVLCSTTTTKRKNRYRNELFTN